MNMKRVTPYIKKEWLNSLANYLETYDYYNIPIIEEVENKIKKFTGSKYALVVNSGSVGIFMCLSLLDKFNCGEVIMSNYGYPSAYKACRFLGLTPISVDMKKNTLSINPDKLKTSITKNTIAVVHIGNNGVVGTDIEEIRDICLENKIFFIEDACPSMLQKYKGINAGCFANVGVYSFAPGKPFLCGEGGAIVTNDEELYERLKNIRHTEKDDNTDPSLNLLLSPFLAAYLNPQLNDNNILDVIKKRENVQKLYKDCGLNIFEESEVTRRYATVMYLSKKAKLISERLTEYGIKHRYKHYTLYEKTGFPVSEEVIEEIIDLPSFYDITENQVSFICSLIRGIEEYE